MHSKLLLFFFLARFKMRCMKAMNCKIALHPHTHIEVDPSFVVEWRWFRWYVTSQQILYESATHAARIHATLWWWCLRKFSSLTNVAALLIMMITSVEKYTREPTREGERQRGRANHLKWMSDKNILRSKFVQALRLIYKLFKHATIQKYGAPEYF